MQDNTANIAEETAAGREQETQAIPAEALQEEDMHEITEPQDAAAEEDDSTQEEEPVTLLCECELNYNKAEAKKYRQTLKGPAIRKGSWIFGAVIMAVGLIFLILNHNWRLCLICAGVTAAYLALVWFVSWFSTHRYYRRTASLWNKQVRIHVYDAGILTEEKKAGQEEWTEREYTYDTFFRITENDERIYLIAGSKDFVILDKARVPFEVLEAIRDLR